jgi:hypothetical protein
MKLLLRKLCFAALLVSTAGIVFAQSDTGTAKQDMKDAGHDTKDAAKKTGHAVKKTTKKTTHKAAKKTKEGAQKVEDKTAPPQ